MIKCASICKNILAILRLSVIIIFSGNKLLIIHGKRGIVYEKEIEYHRGYFSHASADDCHLQ